MTNSRSQKKPSDKVKKHRLNQETDHSERHCCLKNVALVKEESILQSETL